MSQDSWVQVTENKTQASFKLKEKKSTGSPNSEAWLGPDM